jgi:DNA-binding IclR family transcriptional regulator
MSVLARGLVLLDSLSELGEAGVAELSRRVQSDPSQVHRALRVLQRGAYVEQDPQTKKYRLASRVVELASSYLKRVDIRAEARSVLLHLQETTTHTAHLAILSRSYSVIIDQERGPLREFVGRRHGRYRARSTRPHSARSSWPGSTRRAWITSWPGWSTPRSPPTRC